MRQSMQCLPYNWQPSDSSIANYPKAKQAL